MNVSSLEKEFFGLVFRSCFVQGPVPCLSRKATGLSSKAKCLKQFRHATNCLLPAPLMSYQRFPWTLRTVWSATSDLKANAHERRMLLIQRQSTGAGPAFAGSIAYMGT